MQMKLVFVGIVAVLLLQAACSKNQEERPEPPDPQQDNRTLRQKYSVQTDEWPTANWYNGIKRQELGALLAGPTNEELGPEKVKLGEALFFNTLLSTNGRSCGSSCHVPEKRFTDGMSIGFTGIIRHTPTVENAWYLKGNLFWDGRAKTFEDQIEVAITSPVEMNQPMETLPAKLMAEGLDSQFVSAYGTDVITRERILGAIAAYTQTVVSKETPFDRFVKGDHDALTSQQIEGLHLFRTKAGCINCHNGPMFTDLQYHNLGSPSGGQVDSGRYDATRNPDDIGKFRTQGLRNVTKTPPYWHNGAFASIEQVIEAKNQGMPTEYVRTGILSPYIKPLNLSASEKQSLVAFLKALND